MTNIFVIPLLIMLPLVCIFLLVFITALGMWLVSTANTLIMRIFGALLFAGCVYLYILGIAFIIRTSP